MYKQLHEVAYSQGINMLICCGAEAGGKKKKKV